MGLLRLFFTYGILLYFMISHSEVKAQNVIVRGVITDSLEVPLPNANILAFPDSDNEATRFAISNENGKYELRLSTGISYVLKITYLGYHELSHKIRVKDNIIKNFILKPSVDELDEVVLNYKIPVIIKEDTTIYDASAFTTGKERKLREILKKLPGLEVDRDGNVTSQGKKITKVLVEGKIFFTGKSKLAVNNIPANAVDKVEVLNNYNRIGFLKGIQDSDEIALNIRLKEDKKKFVFGDIESGAGVKKRYTVHPNAFYYSPKTNINFIGDINNTGQKSFTISDYLEFEGGVSKLLGDIKGYSNLFTDDFANYLTNDNFRENINRFGAFNIRQAISSKTDFNSYLIANSSDTETDIRTLNEYTTSTFSFTENRLSRNSLKNFFVIGKATLDYAPSKSEDLSLNIFVKFTDNSTDGNITTNNPQQNNVFRTLGQLDGISLRQNLEYNKKFTRKHIIGSEVALGYSKNDSNTNWISDELFLNGLIPLENDEEFDVLQQKETENLNLDAIIKHYWILNNHNHLYISLGNGLTLENFDTDETQRLTTGVINNFSDDNFGNKISYLLNDFFGGIEYKFLVGKFTITPGIFYHNYILRNDQSDNRIINRTNLLLPQIKTEVKFSNSERITFNYKANARFPNSNQLVEKFFLSDFNRVFRGSPDLLNERFKSFSLNYYKFNLFKGLNLNTSLFINKKTQSIKATTALDGIDQFTSLILFNQPENDISGNFNFGKKINSIKFELKGNAKYSEFFQIVNDNTSKNISRRLSMTVKTETFFKKLPNLEFGYTVSPSTYRTNLSTSKFTNNTFFINVDYIFFQDFHLKLDYTKTDYKNINTGVSNNFDVGNASIFYQKEGSPWGFEINSTNIFNTQFRQRNSFSDFLISDQSTFILPRIFLFKTSYRF